MIEHLDAGEKETILDLARIAKAQKTPLLLVGANGRRLSFDIPFKFESSRTTRDWDFAAPMANWDAYEDFRRRATQGAGAKFLPGGNAHRIVHLHNGTFVDLIPFGRISSADGRIQWPGSGQTMSVLGFADALAASTMEEIEDGAEVGLASPAMLAALKILAFADRRVEFSRDLRDLWFIMERYARPEAHETRLFDELAEKFPDPAYYEHRDSLLLGWDMGHQCSNATLEAMVPTLRELADEDLPDLESLVQRTGDLEEQEAARRKIASEFGWLQRGIAMGGSPAM